MLKKTFDRLFTQSNHIQYLNGLKRNLADLLIIGSILKNRASQIFKNTRTKLKRYPTMLKKFKNNKYVYFNGKIFMDCFAPPWPGLAFNRIMQGIAERFGDPNFDWTEFTLALVISITKKCVYRCEHCYAIQTLGSEDILNYDELLKIAQSFIKIGGGVIAWEGGEPLLRFEMLLDLIRNTVPQSDAWIATTAYGLTQEMAQELRKAGLSAAIISLDHYIPEKHNEFRRNKRAFEMVVKGVRIFRANGILPNICVCATRELIEEDGLWDYLELAKRLGVGYIQILDATPAGNYIEKDVLLTNKQIDKIKKFHMIVNTDSRYKNYPGISARALLESDEYFGCSAGCALVYVDSSGNLQACDLLQIAFGNIIEEGFETVYKRLKKYIPHYISGRCPAQTFHKYISNVFEQQKSLPLDYKDCEHILEKIVKRGLPRSMRF